MLCSFLVCHLVLFGCLTKYIMHILVCQPFALNFSFFFG
nr:MAG TPA: hypothetical protein [Caudoviricetes sp.]